MDEEHDLGAGLLEPGADVLGARRLPPRVAKVLHVCAVRGGDGRPALAELPAETARTRSPGERRFTTADSNAPSRMP